MLTHALEWIENGISVIPTGYRSKMPLFDWREYQDRLPSKKEVAAWFTHKHRNMAIVTGWQNLTVLDFDTILSYHAWWEWATVQGGEAELVAKYSRRCLTSRGVHVYLLLGNPTRNLNLAICDGFTLEIFSQHKHDKSQLFNVKGKGGLCTAPPSIHPSGAIYRWLDEQAPIIQVESLESVLPAIPEPEPFTRPPVVPLSPLEAANFEQVNLEQAKRVDLLSFFSELIPSGPGYYLAQCPFHGDEKPSFWIDATRGRCNCFSCGNGKPLDVIDFYSRLHQVDQRQAIRELANFQVGRL